jgi:putative OPT family oligopeptide transporter
MATTTKPVQTIVKGEAPDGHQPFVPDEVEMREFSLPALLVGAVLGIIFGASSLYLVLKVGLTVSASIPVAVLSITLFRILAKLRIASRSTILENNIVQTTGSAGESIAFGVGVTMPALMLLGLEMDIGRVMVVSILGGLLGILMMIPLRRAFIVREHGKLKYPEGTACAQVLIVGEKGGSSAATVFFGFGLAFLYQFLMSGMKLWKEVPSRALSWFKGAVPAIEVNPALLGVGYIIGTRISCIMVAGGVLSSFVMIPVIRLFGDKLSVAVEPARKLIKDMGEDEIWHEYVLYIGAGAVAAGGIISLFQALPLIIGSIRAGLGDIGAAGINSDADYRASVPRTQQDLPFWIVVVGSIALVGMIWATTPLHAVLPWVPNLEMNPVGAVLIVLFGFLFVTVSSRLTGEIGSSSNPISGMTVATLLLTCLIFLLLSWTKLEYQVTALSVAAVVCIAASNGGTTSQDLKTGYLVGATPKWQQIGISIGALSSALVIGWVLISLNRAYTIYSDSARDLPKLSKPLDISQLTDREQGPGGKEYFVWQATDDKKTNPEGVTPGKYLVDDKGQIRWLVDPGINGRLSRRPDGTEVQRFKAPKAVLMAFITKGILSRQLPWSLVLLGVSIAIVLELSGVPSLPFAVGVYLPLSSSTPIFVGGLVRYFADRWARTDPEHPRTEADADSSPGVLLSTGYIAGGTIAGVLIAFLSFGETIPRLLGTWQYSHYTVTKTASIDQVYTDLAQEEVGPGETGHSAEREAALKSYKEQLSELNAELSAEYTMVPERTIVKLPANETYKTDADTTLMKIAQEKLGRAEKAMLLLDLNKDTLKPAATLPAGAEVKLPQRDSAALSAFGVLVGLLLLVGLGLLFRSPPLTGTILETGNGEANRS